jgi:WS/DGAT/MGAT family acyltransferase
MSVRDAGFLYLERPDAGLHIGCVAVLDRKLELEALVRRVEARLPLLPRYAQRAVEAPLALGHPSWEEEPALDLTLHVRRWSLPAPGGESELAETVGALFEQPMARSRPLWEMHLLEGLDGDRCAVMQKVHHCMVDGVAGAQLLEALLDAEPQPPEPARRRRVRARPRGSSDRLRSALADGLRAQARGVAAAFGALVRPAAALQAAERLRRAAWAAVQLATDDVPQMPWNAPIGPHRSLAFTRLPIDGVRRVRRARGGTLNDVVLTAVAGGLRRYLDAHGVPTRGLELTALVPVSLRSAEEARALGNRISAMLVPLAVDPADEVPRLAAMRATTDRLKQGAAWTGIDALLAALDGAPPALVAFASARIRIGRLANLIATNVPGPRETRWLGGARVEALYPLVPIAGGIGLGVAIFSYDDWLHVGLTADARRTTDLDKLRRGIEDAFQALVAGA